MRAKRRLIRQKPLECQVADFVGSFRSTLITNAAGGCGCGVDAHRRTTPEASHIGGRRVERGQARVGGGPVHNLLKPPDFIRLRNGDVNRIHARRFAGSETLIITL